MAVQKMQKVALLVSRNVSQEVLSKVQEHGIFEVVEADAENCARSLESFEQTEIRLAEVAFAIRFLSEAAPNPSSFREKFLGEKIEAQESDALLALEEDLSHVISECVRLEEEYNKTKADISKNIALVSVLDAWKSFSLSLGFDRETKHIEVRLGSVEKKDYADFSYQIEQMPLAHLQTVSESSKNTYFLLIFHRSIKNDVRVQLDVFRFAESDFSEMQGTASEEISELNEKISELQRRLQKNQESKESLAMRYLHKLKLVHDALFWQKEKRSAIKKSTGTKTSLFFVGWIPASRVSLLKEIVFLETKYAEIILLEPDQNEQTPVFLENSNSVSPFEGVVKLFGTPSYSELDPTPFLAPFFVIFFGFCLTDAGYGIFLLIALLVALKTLPIAKGMRSMMHLLLFGSVSTIVMGILFGGYFGLTPDQLSILKNPETGKFYGQLFDPVNELTTKVMPFAYGLGLLQLWVGVVLGGINKWRMQKKRQAIFGSGSLGLIVVVALMMGLLPDHVFWLKNILFGLIALLVYGFSPSEGGIVYRFLVGVLGVVNELVSWLSNVLSYSRLFALGLATGVIALAFNSIAVTIGGLLPAVIGIPVMILILLFGHSLNVGLNLLGAFIHSARLQFVEFFGTFFEGGGREFVPLRRRSKYLFS